MTQQQPTMYQLYSDHYIQSDRPMTYEEIKAVWPGEYGVIEYGCFVVDKFQFEIIATDVNEVTA